MLRIRAGWLAAPLLLLAAPAHAQPLRIEILRFGEWATDPANTPRDPALRDDTLSGVQPVRLLSITRDGPDVAGRYCAGFGLTFRVDGLANGATAVLLVRNRHPRLTRPDGASSEEDAFEIRVGSDTSWTGFLFAESWSLVPGRWTFSLSHQGRELARQEFDVRRAENPGSPEENGCGRLLS